MKTLDYLAWICFTPATANKYARKAQQLYSFEMRRVNSNFISVLKLTDLREVQTEQLGKLLQLRADMTNANGAVMGWRVRVPVVDEFPRANREPIAAVGISYFQYGT